MKFKLLAAALALLAVSNAWVLAHVAANRSGTPDADMELTARELTWEGARTESSRVVLALRWQNPAPEFSVGPDSDSSLPGWFNQQKLAELGFDVSVPPDSREASQFYQNSRSREVFVALELDGPSWTQWLKEREAQLQQEARYSPPIPAAPRLETELNTASRLVAVDAGLDGASLRRKYPDRKHVLILRGLARARWEMARAAFAGKPARPAYLHGVIRRLLTETVNVPLPFSRQFDSRLAFGRWASPPYVIDLRAGSRYEPWVTNLRLAN